ncbi:MAG TPA: hypothetical protein VFJ64_10715 [Solirubrobacterales bacterium]|nr:hypothetical protein [Solirubrobacterales bacterium]
MNTSKPIVAINDAAHAAAVAAAKNAGKPGVRTSELWVSIAGVALAALAGLVLPGAAAVAVPVAIGAAAATYAASRGSVKSSALAAAAAVAQTVPGPLGELAGDAAAIVEAATGGGGG